MALKLLSHAIAVLVEASVAFFAVMMFSSRAQSDPHTAAAIIFFLAAFWRATVDRYFESSMVTVSFGKDKE